MKSVFVFFVLLIPLLISCGKDPTIRAKAYLKKAEQLLAIGDYNRAKLNLDSIHSLFPQLIPMRQAADTVMYRVTLSESKRNLLFADSQLPVRKHLADSLLRAFRYEKDARYEDEGRYLYKALGGIGTSRTGIKTYLTESGELTLVSAYCGAPLGFTKTKIACNDLFAETIAGSGESRNAFSFQGVSRESVSYTGPEINGIDAFVVHNASAKLTTTFEGGKRSYSYVLSQPEKMAIAQSSLLSTILKSVEQLQKDIVRSKEKITIVCRHLHLDPKEQLPEKFR
jgi:hypothetical protein